MLHSINMHIKCIACIFLLSFACMKAAEPSQKYEAAMRILHEIGSMAEQALTNESLEEYRRTQAYINQVLPHLRQLKAACGQAEQVKINELRDHINDVLEVIKANLKAEAAPQAPAALPAYPQPAGHYYSAAAQPPALAYHSGSQQSTPYYEEAAHILHEIGSMAEQALTNESLEEYRRTQAYINQVLPRLKQLKAACGQAEQVKINELRDHINDVLEVIKANLKAEAAPQAPAALPAYPQPAGHYYPAAAQPPAPVQPAQAYEPEESATVQFQHFAGINTPIPTWHLQYNLSTKPDQNWWQKGKTLSPRKQFFKDIVGMDERTFRDSYRWSRHNLFDVTKLGGHQAWIQKYPRRAALYAGTQDHATGIHSIRDLKGSTTHKKGATRPYFSILVYDPYVPWESDIRYLQSIPQNKDAAFQLASTFFGPLEGGIATEHAYVENMFPGAAQGEEASAAVGGATIYRKYIMPGTPLYLLHYLQDKLPMYHTTHKGREVYAVDNNAIMRYHYIPGDEDRVQVFIQNDAVATLGYGSHEQKGHKGEGAQQRLEVYTDAHGNIDKARAQTVCQIFTSALNLKGQWQSHSGQMTIDHNSEAAARMLLRASYEGTCLATAHAGKHRLFLTMMGGGAFANDVSWIGQAITDTCILPIRQFGLQVTTIYHPDKIRKAGVGPARNAKADRKLFDALLHTYDEVNGTQLARHQGIAALVQTYLDLAYKFQNDPSIERKLHESAQELNAILMWQPYSGRL